MTVENFQKASERHGYTVKVVTPNYFGNGGFKGKALSIEKGSKWVCVMPLLRQKTVQGKPMPKMQFTEDPNPSRAEYNLIMKFADKNIA